MEIAGWIICVLVAVGFLVASIVALKVKKWSMFALIFAIMMSLSIAVRVSALWLNNLDNSKDYENNILVLIFKSIYSSIGGLQFEGLDDIKSNCMALYNTCLLPLYYILPSIIGLMTIAKLSQSLVYEYYCKVKWRFKTIFTRWNSSQEVYVFTSLTEDTIQLCDSISMEIRNPKIIFFGDDIPKFDTHNPLCKYIKSNRWYYISNNDGRYVVSHWENEDVLQEEKKQCLLKKFILSFRNFFRIYDRNETWKNSILNKLHLIRNFWFHPQKYKKLCIISMHQNDNHRPDDEKNLSITYDEYKAFIEGTLPRKVRRYRSLFKLRNQFYIKEYTLKRIKINVRDVKCKLNKVMSDIQDIVQQNLLSSILKDFLDKLNCSNVIAIANLKNIYSNFKENVQKSLDIWYRMQNLPSSSNDVAIKIKSIDRDVEILEKFGFNDDKTFKDFLEKHFNNRTNDTEAQENLSKCLSCKFSLSNKRIHHRENNFNFDLMEYRRQYNKFGIVEFYALVGKEINYEAYQDRIDSFVNDICVYHGMGNAKEVDGKPIFQLPEFYVLNEAHLTADDLVKDINNCCSWLISKQKEKIKEKINQISNGLIVGFSELGQAVLHSLYVQFNYKNQNVKFDIYDNNLKTNLDISDISIVKPLLNQDFIAWERTDFTYKYKIDHPYFSFNGQYSLCGKNDLEDYKKVKDITGSSINKILENDCLELFLYDTNNLYNVLDKNTGVGEGKPLDKDIIVLTTGDDEQNAYYANFLINDIEHEYWVQKNVLSNQSINKRAQIIAVNIRYDINNSLINLSGFKKICNNVYYNDDNGLVVIIFGNTDEVYGYHLLNHDNSKDYNTAYRMTLDLIDKSGLDNYSESFFADTKSDIYVWDLYCLIKNEFQYLNDNDYKLCWSHERILRKECCKSSELFKNNYKKMENGADLKENILREHHRWCRFYMTNGWQLRAETKLTAKKHDSLLPITLAPKGKRFYGILNIYLAEGNNFASFKNEHKGCQLSNKKNESTKNSNN